MNNRKIKHYIILTGHVNPEYRRTLADKINSFLKGEDGGAWGEGHWELYGNPYLEARITELDGAVHAQAMVKYHEG